MSLPYLFKTTIHTIPAEIPYLFSDTEKVKLWDGKLGEKKCFRIGLSWSGSKNHKNDHNRSIQLKELLPLLEMPFEFHSLQKEYRDSDLQVLEKSKIKKPYKTSPHT